MRGYKTEFLKSNPEPALEYSVVNVVANGCLKIEDDENPLYWVKVKNSLYTLVFNKKINNQLIMYVQGEVSTSNLSINILKMKEPWTEKV